MSNPLVSVVVVTYNSATYIENSLQSLKMVNYKPLELVIVDNASTDNTLHLVEKHTAKFSYPVRVIKNKGNHGYAKGNNIGVKAAIGKLVFILNPDTQVAPHFLTPLVATMESSKEIGACQPTVYLMNNLKRLNLTGKVTNYLGFDWLKDYLMTKVPVAQKLTSFSGSGVLIRKNIFIQLGGFDEHYFMYQEDSDLSWRIRLSGFTIQYVPTSTIYHDYKYQPDPSYQSFSQKFYFHERNRLITIFKNYSIRSLLLILPMVLLMETALIIFAVGRGLGKAKLSTYIDVWKLRREIGKSRQRVQKKRVLTDRDVTKHFLGGIMFKEFSHPLLKNVLNPIFELYWSVVRKWL